MVSHQTKLEVVSNHIAKTFFNMTVNSHSVPNEDRVKLWYGQFEALINKVIRERKFEARIIRQASEIAKNKVLSEFAEYLI